MNRSYQIAIAGNPNSGKTSLFNLLTGNNGKVGNWPGVTVDKIEGLVKQGGQRYRFVDLPGCYSLSPDTEDQQIASDYLASGTADLCLNIVDAVNLSRNLYLTMEIIRTSKCPTVVLLNKMDLAKREKIQIDVKKLEKQLGVPVIEVTSIDRKSVSSAFASIRKLLKKKIEPSTLSVPETTDAVYAKVDEICSEVISHDETGLSTTAKIDKVVLNPRLALPIFLGAMYLVFWFAVNLGGVFIDFFDITAGAVFVDGLGSVLESIGVWNWLKVILADGVGAGIQTVATFIPVIFFMFMSMAILEDSGYFTRAAYIADRMMRKIGLPGDAFIPLLVGFGCTVPAIMGMKTLRKREDRLKAIFMAPFMSCGARLPVYALFCAALYGKWSGLVVFAIYLSGIILAILTGLLLKKTVYAGAKSDFILELPEYHLPRFRNVIKVTWIRLKAFLKKATLIIVTAVTILGFLNSIGIEEDGSVSFGNEDSPNSVLTITGKAITPALEPIGIEKENWPASVALFTGLFAKEAIVGTVNALYSQLDSAPESDSAEEAVEAEAEEEGSPFLAVMGEALGSVKDNFIGIFTSADLLGVSLVTSGEEVIAEELETESSVFAMLQKHFTGYQAFAYMLFVLIYFPCIAVLGAIYRRAGLKFTVAVTVYCTVLAYAVATLFYQIAEGRNGLYIILSAAILAAIIGTFKGVELWRQKREKNPAVVAD